MGVNEELVDCIEGVLREHPAGLGEHALVSALRERGVAPFDRARLREPLSLFQTHFLLFHCLYRLRDRRSPGGEWLRIDCLDIGFEPLALRAATESADDVRTLVASDPLRAYYMDLSRLDRMDAAAVEALLSGFWRRLHSDERRGQALAVLGLEDPVDEAAIEARYRALVQRHHPDRGGDAATIQRLNEARWLLRAARSESRVV